MDKFTVDIAFHCGAVDLDAEMICAARLDRAGDASVFRFGATRAHLYGMT